MLAKNCRRIKLAHTKSAKKCIRQTEKRRLHNKAIRTFFRERIKECRDAIETGKQEDALKAFKSAEKAIAGAVSKGIIKHNTGSRYTSRLQLMLNKLLSQKAA
jgi:small subunit ribosomal protein S20